MTVILEKIRYCSLGHLLGCDLVSSKLLGPKKYKKLHLVAKQILSLQ